MLIMDMDGEIPTIRMVGAGEILTTTDHIGDIILTIIIGDTRTTATIIMLDMAMDIKFVQRIHLFALQTVAHMTLV